MVSPLVLLMRRSGAWAQERLSWKPKYLCPHLVQCCFAHLLLSLGPSNTYDFVGVPRCVARQRDARTRTEEQQELGAAIDGPMAC